MADKRRRDRDRSSKEGKNAPPPPPKYDPPSWAGKPPQGMHLDVMKGEKLVEKLIIDGKTHYMFGRNKDHVDFPLDHASCSRQHAVLVFHKHLQRMFIIDLGSTHGTFIGTIRVESNRPMQVAVDSTLAFGASTRRYTLREKPNLPASSAETTAVSTTPGNEDEEEEKDPGIHGLLGLPESDTELDDLTEFNTAHNRRLATLPIEESNTLPNLKKRRRSFNLKVEFKENEEIINPEDVDPSVGRFRNLVQTEVVIPMKKMKPSSPQDSNSTNPISKRVQDFSYSTDLYADLPALGEEGHAHGTPTAAISGRMRITSAPDVEAPDLVKPKIDITPEVGPKVNAQPTPSNDSGPQEPAKKKYMKEAWPGKKPAPNLLSV